MSVNGLDGMTHAEGEEATWSFFAESEPGGVSARELTRVLSLSDSVLEATVKGDEDGFLADTSTFPIAWNTGERAVLMRAKNMASMFDRIREVFGSGGDVVLYEAGLAFGRAAWSSLVDNIGRGYVVEHIPEVLQLYNAAGWARVTVPELDLERRKAVVRTYDNFECAGHRSDTPWSQFVRGNLSGALCVLMQCEKGDCRETRCSAVHGDACEFAWTGGQD